MRPARQLAALLLAGLLAGLLPSAALAGTGQARYVSKLRFEAVSGRTYDLVAVVRSSVPLDRVVVGVRSRRGDTHASLELRRGTNILRLPRAAGPVTVLVQGQEKTSSFRAYVKRAIPGKSALTKTAVIGAAAIGAAAVGGDAVGTDPFTGVGVGSGQATASDPSGVPMPGGDLPGWRQVFSDDFTTDVPVGGFSGCRWDTNLMDSQCSGLPAAVAAKWWAYPDGWPDTTHNGQYSPSQVLSIHNRVLDIHLHTANGIHMVAAPVPKIPGGVNGFGRRYGAYVVRFKADPVPGYKTAWLLWPDSDAWPSDGEIDFPEGNLDSNMSAFMHWMGATSGTQQDVYPTSATYGEWHTATVEWTPKMVRFILDGTIVGTSTEHVPSDPMHWVLQTETATDGTTPTDSAAGHVLIAWAVAYSQT